MTCIPYDQWFQYRVACNAKNNPLSVKGFGYVLAGLRGLGATGLTANQVLIETGAPLPATINTSAVDTSDPCYLAAQTPCPQTPSNAPPLVCPAGQIRSCPFVPAGQQMDWSKCSCSSCLEGSAWYAAQLACNAGDKTQCAVTNTRPCVAPVPCPSGTRVVVQVPRQATTGAWGSVAVSYCSASGSASAPPSGNALPGGVLTASATAAGGFSHWGLLAAVVVGGGALYLAMRKKG